MGRILFVAMANIHIQSGGGLANRAFYDSLLSHFPDKVDIVQFAEFVEAEDQNSLGVPCKSLMSKICDFHKGIIHRFNPWLIQYLKEKGGEYSCCIINSGLLGDIIFDIKKYIPKVVIIHHNDEVAFQLDNNRPTTLFGTFPYWVNKNQKLAYINADLNLFLTDYDRISFENKYGASIGLNKVIGVFETQNSKDITNLGQLNERVLVITGALHNVQTIKGIKSFCSSYLPLLSSYFNDDFRLLIAGRKPGKFIQDLQSENVIIVADPYNMDSVVKKAGVFLCPINVGSGIKLRIMDGLKMGLPILTHEVSARGYEYFAGEDWFQIYSDEKSFIIGLQNISRAMSTNANLNYLIREKYCEYFSFLEGDKRFQEFLKEAGVF